MESKKIHLVMPMAGKGSRFKEQDGLPKPLIMLQGKPFFFWATQSLVKFVDIEDITFVVLKEHVEFFNIDKEVLKYYPHAKIIVIAKVLDGAVLTCNAGLMGIDDDKPIVFNDCDHAFICTSFYDYLKNGGDENVSGGILSFESQNPAYSYLEKNEQGLVRKTVEKCVISNEAICGCYYFQNKKIFKIALDSYLTKCVYNEFFVSGMYNIMAEQGAHILSFKTDLHISFGVPEEYAEAKNDDRLMHLL